LGDRNGSCAVKPGAFIKRISLLLTTMPLHMQASIFGACPKPRYQVGGLQQEGHLT